LNARESNYTESLRILLVMITGLLRHGGEHAAVACRTPGVTKGLYGLRGRKHNRHAANPARPARPVSEGPGQDGVEW
jgi:hypothetical protein